MGEPKDRTSPRAAPTGPIDNILDQLFDLMTHLDTHENKGSGSGMLEKYDYFNRVSDKGRACTYGMKAKQMYLNYDWPKTKTRLEKLIVSIRQIPGYEEFGK